MKLRSISSVGVIMTEDNDGLLTDEQIRNSMVDGWWSGWDEVKKATVQEVDFERGKRLTKVLLDSHKRIAKAQQAITRRDIIAELRALPSSNTQEFAIAVAEWITKQEGL